MTEACEGGCEEEENCEGYCYKVTDIDPGYYTLTVNADGGYEKDFKRIIDFVVIDLEIYRDEDCTRVLDDWPEEDGLVRSPKFIFGKKDYIYIDVEGPEGLGNEIFTVSVTNAKHGDSVDIFLSEISDGKYRNTASDGQLLGVGRNTEPMEDGYRIRVVNEEVLEFELKVEGEKICEADVMVDRGEFLGVAGSDSPPGTAAVYDINDALWRLEIQLGDKDDLIITDKYGWWNNGTLEGTAYENCDDVDREAEERKVEALQRGYDDEYADSPADFLFYGGHGTRDLRIYIHHSCASATCHPPILWQPEYHVGDWIDDVNFAMFLACNILGTAGERYAFVEHYIEHVMNPTKVHSIMATSAGIRGPVFSPVVRRVLNDIMDGTNMVDAYKEACTWPRDDEIEYGVLVRHSHDSQKSNREDYMVTPLSSADETQVMSRSYPDVTEYMYYWYDGEEGHEMPFGDTEDLTALEFQESVVFADTRTQVPDYQLTRRMGISSERMEADWDQFDTVRSAENELNARDDVVFFTYEKRVHEPMLTEDEFGEHIEGTAFSVPEGYRFESKGKMMRKSFSSRDGEVTSGEAECEGQVFRYRRFIDGYRIVNDRVTYHLRNEKVTRFSKMRHSIEQVGEVPILDARVLPEYDDRVSVELCYLVYENEVIPVWEVRSHPPHPVKHFDARTGEDIYDF